MVAMKLIVMWSLALASNSQKFLPIHQDPADALADKLLNKVGFDSDDKEEPKVPAAVKHYVKNVAPSIDESNAHDDVSAGKSHNRLSSRDLMGFKPMMATGTLTTPQQWAAGSSQESDESGLSSLRTGMKHMYQDLANPPQVSTSTADWSQFHRDASETSKEIVKVFDRDVVHQPVQQVSASDDKSSAPAYLNKLRLPASLGSEASAGLRWFKQPVQAHAVRDESSTKTLQHDQVTHSMNVTELEDQVEKIKEEEEGTDSLANSLKSHFKIENQKEIARKQRRDLPTGDEHHRNLTKPTEPPEPETSALDSLHKGLRGSKKMLKVRPEDVYNATDTPKAPKLEEEEMPETKPVLRPEKGSVPVPPKLKQVFDKPAKETQESHVANQSPEEIFKMHAVGGFVDADGMEAVLDELGTKKNWNWQLFDKDGDDKLSAKEFANAVMVAQRFKFQK